MSAYFFETSEEDSFLEVAKLIGELLDAGEVQEGEEQTATAGSRFVEESVELYAQQSLPELLAKYIGQLDLVFAHAANDESGVADLEGVLDILCHLVPRAALAGPGHVTQATERLASALCAEVPGATEQRKQRLQALVTLNNVLPAGESDARHSALLSLLGYAKAIGAVELLLPLVQTGAKDWIAALQSSAEEASRARAVLVAAADALTASTPDSPALARAAALEANRLFSEVTLSYKGSPLGAEDRAAVAEAAKRVTADFCAAPDTFTFDLVDTPAVRQLANDANTKPLHALLHTMLGGSVGELENTSPELLSSLGLTPEAALAKTRLMALAALAHSRPVLGFDELREALGVDAAEVEPLVVRAVGRKLLDARIDQLARTVTVTRCEPRSFGPADWKELQATLHNWQRALERAEQVAEDRKSLLLKGLTAIKA